MWVYRQKLRSVLKSGVDSKGHLARDNSVKNKHDPRKEAVHFDMSYILYIRKFKTL